MKCPECGYTTSDRSTICERCGAPLYTGKEDVTNPFDHSDEDVHGETREEKNPLSDSGDHPDPEAYKPGELFSEDTYSNEQNTYTEIYKSIKRSVSSSRVRKVVNPATLKERAFAIIIDLVLLIIASQVTISTGLYFLDLNPVDDFNILRHMLVPAYVIIFVLLSTYFPLSNAIFGRTVGKMAIGISVISEEGESVSALSSSIRWVGYYISAFPLLAGFFWAVLDADNQCWHDKLAGTYVIRDYSR